MLKKPHKFSKNIFKNNVLPKFSTMNTPSGAAWYRVPNMASGSNCTIYHAIETGCLAMRKFARHCYAKNEKSPQLCGLMGVLMLFGASLCRTWDHSHSIIYDNHNQLSDNIFPNLNFSRTVLYTVTGNQYHEKCHAIWSGCRIVFRRLFRLRLPGQHTLPVVCFSREIC